MPEHTDQSSFTLLQIIKNMTQNFLKIVSHMTQLAHLEARLAGKSLVNLIILTFILGTFLTSTWLCIVAFLLVFFVSVLQWSWLFAFLVAIIINLAVIGFIALKMLQLKENLFFPATRKQLKQVTSSKEELAHARITEKN